ncbi:HAD family hydrolase [Peribacillus sp. SCS-37]|uniref:HAD family hydrolase n=1 Tax=Paraperibacillus esterisolvens TaxID=3115296 RepID=UPI003905EEDF
MYRIVFLDIDGTILNSREEMDEKLITAIRELQQRGILIGLATGRSFDASIIYGEKFGCSMYVTYNGGYVIHNKKVIHDAKIPAALANELCRKTDQLNGTYIHFADRQSVSNHPPQGIEYLLPNAKKAEIDVTNCDAHRLVLYLNAEDRAALQTDISGAAVFDEGDRLEVFSTKSKWTGILPLITELGISPEEVVTIGNGTNDIGMLSSAGLGIAMRNSPDCVKESSDWVTEDNDNHGVVLALNKVFNLYNDLVSR